MARGAAHSPGLNAFIGRRSSGAEHSTFRRSEIPPAVGRPAIANPDLVTRWERGADENAVDQASVYGPDERGYTDYPFLQD